MNRRPINPNYKQHLANLLDWLFDEIISSSGDGDAAWVVKDFDITEVRTFVLGWLRNNPMLDWQCSEIQEDRYFTVHRDQEVLTITLDEQDVPWCSQCTIRL